MNREVEREIYEPVLDENGNPVLDENGVAVLQHVGTEIVIEPDPTDPREGEILNPVMHIDDSR